MNKVILTGRLTRDADIRVTANTQTTVARFTLAVNRRSKDDGADFIGCIAFNKTAELIEKYVRQGHRIGIVGHIQTGSYEKEGVKHYTQDVIVDELEFLETKSGNTSETHKETQKDGDGFMPLPDDVDDEGLPF